MSDYGFVTYDEKTGRVSEKINSKYPIFGPEYKNIATQFRTIRLVETTERSPDDISSSVAVPGWQNEWEDGYWYGKNYVQRTVEEEVFSYKHNLGKRPLGYYTVTGTITRNVRADLVQKVQAGSGYGGKFNIYKNLTISRTLRPVPNTMTELAFGSNVGFWNYSIVQPYNNKSWADYVDYQCINIPNACLSAFANTPGQSNLLGDDDRNANGDIIDPYRVVIDDEKVHIYKRYHWVDNITRSGKKNGSLDIRQRTKAIEDFAGSTIDITVYLVPFSEGDLK